MNNKKFFHNSSISRPTSRLLLTPKFKFNRNFFTKKNPKEMKVITDEVLAIGKHQTDKNKTKGFAQMKLSRKQIS